MKRPQTDGAILDAVRERRPIGRERIAKGGIRVLAGDGAFGK